MHIACGVEHFPDHPLQGGTVLQPGDMIEQPFLAGMQRPVHHEENVEGARQQGREPVLHFDRTVAYEGQLDRRSC